MSRPFHMTLATLLVGLSLLVLAGDARGQGRITLRRPVIVTLVPPGIITADGTPQTLLFVVTDETGSLASEARWVGSRADIGTLAGWTQIGPGVWTATHTVPPVSESHQVLLDVQVKVGKYKAQKQFPVLVQPASRPRFTMTSTPEQLVLGTDEMAVLTFTAVGPAGNPLDGLDLSVGSSIGTVGEVKGLGGGAYRAEYQPPADHKGPALVILSLVERDTPESSTVFLPLQIVADIQWKVDAGEPFTAVGMSVGDQSFGPEVTGEDGTALVPIQVPPGIRTASAFKVDAEGNPSEPMIVDLGPPPFKSLEVAAMAEYIPGNGVAGFPVYLFVTGQDARPMANPPLELEASLGEFASVDGIGAGTYRAIYVPPPVEEPTEVTISAVLLGETQHFGDRITTTVVPGPPSGLLLTTKPTIVSSGTQTITLTGQVLSPTEALAPGVGVAFAGLGGVIPMEAALGDGVFEAGYTASFDQPAPISAEVLIPGAVRKVAAVVAWPVMDQVPVKGTMPIVAMALDRYGLPVTDVELNALTLDNVGSVTGGGPTDYFGRVVFEFQATPLPGAAAVVITDGEHTFACPLWQAETLMLGFGFPPQGGKQQSGMMMMWGGLRGRLLVGAGAPPPPSPQQQAASAASSTPVTQPDEPPPPVPTIWGDDPSTANSGTGADDPAAAWAAEVEARLTGTEPEKRALRDVTMTATDDGKYDIVARYSHAATVVMVGDQRVQRSVHEWFSGWAAQVGNYTRSSSFKSRDFRLTNVDTGKTLVLSTRDCRSVAGLSESRRADWVQGKAREE